MSHSTHTSHSPLSINGEGQGVRFSHPATRPDDGRHRRARPAPARAIRITFAAYDYLKTYKPILLHEEFKRRLAAGDKNAVALQKACDRWQLIRDAAYRLYCHQAPSPHLTRAQFHDLNDELGKLCRAGQHKSPRAVELRRLLAWPVQGDETTPSPLTVDSPRPEGEGSGVRVNEEEQS